MWKFKSIVMGVLSVFLLGGLAQAQEMNTRHVSGEVAWVDVNLGKLQLREESLAGYDATPDYRINQQATNVTDPSDTKFFVLEDLRPGQKVGIDFEYQQADTQTEKLARKVVIEYNPPPLELAVGTVELIDVNAGTLVLNDEPPIVGADNHSYYFFDYREIVVMRSPNPEPIRLELRRGDPIKVEFIRRDGKKWLRSITVYPGIAELTKKTTTVTTTTSTTTTGMTS